MIPMAGTANDLVLKCTAMARTGADFPTVWDAVLKGHALVAGPPVQILDDEGHPQLEISSTVNVSSTTQHPMNTLFCGLQAAAHFWRLPKNRYDRLRVLLRSWTARCLIENRVHVPLHR
jgi:hypothetical protein